MSDQQMIEIKHFGVIDVFFDYDKREKETGLNPIYKIDSIMIDAGDIVKVIPASCLSEKVIKEIELKLEDIRKNKN